MRPTPPCNQSKLALFYPPGHAVLNMVQTLVWYQLIWAGFLSFIKKSSTYSYTHANSLNSKKCQQAGAFAPHVGQLEQSQAFKNWREWRWKATTSGEEMILPLKWRWTALAILFPDWETELWAYGNDVQAGCRRIWCKPENSVHLLHQIQTRTFDGLWWLI